MNRTQTLAVVLMAALLPLTSAAFASDRGHDDRRDRRHSEHRGHNDGHHYGHHYGHHGDHRHHNRHYCRQDHRGEFHHYDRGHNARVVLPYPPLPPFPVVVLHKKHHGAHIDLHHSR